MVTLINKHRGHANWQIDRVSNSENLLKTHKDHINRDHQMLEEKRMS